MITKGCIYYTDNRPDPIILRVCQEQIKKSFAGEIISVSLKPIDFGKNIVLNGVQRSYTTMVRQIIMGLEALSTDYVFYLEHDVIYNFTHFDFTPPQDDVFYYNSNCWRWRLWDNKAITYDGMLPLSCMCANRQFALDHYHKRMEKIIEWGLDEFRSREPRRARIWGYEPGRKPRRRGGFSDDKSDIWTSEFPNVDIRHRRTFSSLKCSLDSFAHQPTGWREIPSSEIPGWNLQELFDLKW